MRVRYVFGLLLLALSFVTGCQNGNLPSGITDSIPTVYNDVQRGSAYVENAKTLTDKAKPEANSTGQALLNVASDQQQKAIDTLKTANQKLNTAESERQSVEKKFKDVSDANDKLTKSWGHRLQVFVTWGFWIIIALFAFHAIGGFVALAIPGPVGSILSVAAAFVNPLAWIQTIKDNIFFRKALAAKSTVLDMNGNAVPSAA